MNKLQPLYQQIYDHYKEMILSHQLSAASRLPSEQEIARSFSVSRITVSRALGDLEKDGLITRVKGSGSYVNDLADADRISGAPKFISLILPFHDEFSMEILKGVEEVAREQGYFVTFHNSKEDHEQEKAIAMELMAGGSVGFISYSVDPQSNMDLYSRLMISQYPFVLIDRNIQGLNTSLVWVDNQQGSYDLTCHLIERGHRQIIYLGESVFEVSSETERYKGFCKAHIDHGVPLMHKNLLGTQMDQLAMPDDYMVDADRDTRVCHYLYDLLDRMEPDERPTAIVGANDQIAALLIKIAMDRGIAVPEDYAITGFDDLAYAAHLPVPLTTVAQPAEQIGRLAATELLRRIQDRQSQPQVQTVKGEIVIRESTMGRHNGEGKLNQSPSPAHDGAAHSL